MCVEKGQSDGLSSRPLSLLSLLLGLVPSVLIASHRIASHRIASHRIAQYPLQVHWKWIVTLHCRRECCIVVIIVVWMTTTNTAVVGRDAIICHASRRRCCCCLFCWWEKTIRERGTRRLVSEFCHLVANSATTTTKDKTGQDENHNNTYPCFVCCVNLCRCCCWHQECGMGFVMMMIVVFVSSVVLD